MKFKKHIFICTNERASGERISCGVTHGLALVAAFKKSLLDKGLKTEVRAQRAGCLDACESGPTLVIYPEGVYYRNVQLSDVEEIIQKHIIEHSEVERLVLKDLIPVPEKINTDISVYKKDAEIIRQTAVQLEKDFASNGIDIIFSGNALTVYDELFPQVKTAVKFLLETNRTKFAQLLYTIDLSEQKANEIFADNAFPDAVEKITQFILERELLKVITRKYYSA